MKFEEDRRKLCCWSTTSYSQLLQLRINFRFGRKLPRSFEILPFRPPPFQFRQRKTRKVGVPWLIVAPIFCSLRFTDARRNLRGESSTIGTFMQLSRVETYAFQGVTRVNPAHANKIPRFKAGRGRRRGAASNGLEIRIETAARCVARARSWNASGIPASSCPRVLSNS